LGGRQAIRFLVTLILARILAPDDYGLLAMATVVTGLAEVLRNFGLSKVIIQRKVVGEELLSSLFFVNVVIGCLLVVGLIGIGPVFSCVYADERVARLITALSLPLLFNALGQVYYSLLLRRMAFSRLALVDWINATVQGATSIGLALCGWGVWGLVWGIVAASAVRNLLLHFFCRWRPRATFRWSEVRAVSGFAANAFGYSIVSYFTLNADSAIIGAVFGSELLGFYSLGYGTVLKLPLSLFAVLGHVLFPVFSRMQDNHGRLKATYLRALSGVMFLAFPAVLGLVVLAEPFVGVALGKKWLPIVPIICLLSPVAMLHPVDSLRPHILLSVGRADVLFRWEVVSGTLRILSLLAGVPWGLHGVLVAYVVTYCTLTMIGLLITFRHVHNLSIHDIVRPLAYYGGLAGIMAASVLACRTLLEQIETPDVFILGTGVATGVLVYVALILTTRPVALRDFVRLLLNRSQSRTCDQPQPSLSRDGNAAS